MRTLLAAVVLAMLSGEALANHECRLETFNTISGRAARLVPIGPNAHCGVRGRRLSANPASVRRLGTSRQQSRQVTDRYWERPWDPSPNR